MPPLPPVDVVVADAPPLPLFVPFAAAFAPFLAALKHAVFALLGHWFVVFFIRFFLIHD
jgi:hypothetical protein